MRKKVLIITPRSPFQGRGADELDRLSGIKWFLEEEYEVCVITKTMPSDLATIEISKRELGITIIPVSYKFTQQNKFLRAGMSFFRDNAAHEYFDKDIQTVLRDKVTEWKPDIVWFDYTYLWPLYSLIPKGTPIYTRSINFEPTHFLDEDGRWPWNYIRVIPKFLSEWRVAQRSTAVFAITPQEEKKYILLGARSTILPLRGLPNKQDFQRRISNLNDVIHLGFTGSTYSVEHNVKALLFILQEVLPALRKGSHRYVFHFTGSRLPEDIKKILTVEDVYEGFVPSMKDFWQTIDIALVPSLFGAGMQQKVFEPLVLGVPTITSKRALAGYPFRDNEVVCAETPRDFIHVVEQLSGNEVRRRTLSNNAQEVSSLLFSRETINNILRSHIS